MPAVVYYCRTYEQTFVQAVHNVEAVPNQIGHPWFKSRDDHSDLLFFFRNQNDVQLEARQGSARR